MGAEKRWRLVCYDVRDPKRYRRLFKIMKGSGESVQYSVFRCHLDDSETERLRWRLSEVMAPEDALLVIDLCPSCARKVVSRNHVEGWTEQPATFRIVGQPLDTRPSGACLLVPREGNQAPAAAAGRETAPSANSPEATEENDE